MKAPQGAAGIFNLLQLQAKLCNDSFDRHKLLFPAIQPRSERQQIPSCHSSGIHQGRFQLAREWVHISWHEGPNEPALAEKSPESAAQYLPPWDRQESRGKLKCS
jgi:hypothetical protein